jgi:dephospho-CoA kinase
MIKLAITGSIASGKTLAESILKEKNIPTIDADLIVRRLLAQDKEVIEKISNVFSPAKEDIFDPQGKICRKKLGKIVFNNKEKLGKLEEILHPKVKEEINNFFAQNKDEKIAVAVVPVLYEANMQNMFDYVILFCTKKVLQIKRLMERDGLSQEQAENRISLFIDDKEKIKKADFVIHNDLKAQDVRGEIENILENL